MPVKRRVLSRKAFLASFDHPMRRATRDADVEVDLGPYVERCISQDELPTTTAEIDVEGVYRGERRPVAHIMLGWGESARRLLVVIDTDEGKIVGDHVVDLHADFGLYGLPAPKGALTPAAAVGAMKHCGFQITKKPNGYYVLGYDAGVVPHDLLASLGRVGSMCFTPRDTQQLEMVCASPALAKVQLLQLKSVKASIDWSCVARLSSLETLNLYFARGGGADLSVLARLPSLRHLLISEAAATSIEPLRELTQLRSLSVHYLRRLEACDVILDLPHLSELSLRDVPTRGHIASVAELRGVLDAMATKLVKKTTAKKKAAQKR